MRVEKSGLDFGGKKWAMSDKRRRNPNDQRMGGLRPVDWDHPNIEIRCLGKIWNENGAYGRIKVPE
jgi:hypothetical protein